MPLNRPPLLESDIRKIQDWIDQGAKAQNGEAPGTAPVGRHWSFVAPERPIAPKITKNGWSRNAIDDFILARLEHVGLSPSPEADRGTLLRRVSLDLTGLPPSPAEIAAFRADPAPDAIDRVVERLMASPHFGERLARPWLDQARYADSNGYNIDAPRSIWKYRDWVIAAINADLPFDQFTIDQIAGDLRHSREVAPLIATPLTTHHSPLTSLIATGFHRNTQINQEGGIDVEQFRIEAIVDRVNTTGTVFLGLTIGCAMPRPQIRPDLAARLLPPVRVLQQRRRARARACLSRRVCDTAGNPRSD